MKTRQGFVSNSSSSSFVIFGKDTDLWDITNPKEENIWVIGGILGEGWDVFPLTMEMLMELRNVEGKLNLVKAYKTMYSEIGDYCEVENDLPPKFTVYALEKDQHSTYDIDLFIERYIKRS